MLKILDLICWVSARDVENLLQPGNFLYQTMFLL